MGIYTLFTNAALTIVPAGAIIILTSLWQASAPAFLVRGGIPMIRNAIQRLMYGRYGNDQLNMALIGLYLVCYLVSSFTRFVPLAWLSLVLLILVLLRMFSRNLPRRRAENAKFLSLTAPAAAWLRLRRTIHRDKEHRYFKCPNCGQQLRVPRGKGRITVTCRGCGATFQEKS